MTVQVGSCPWWAVGKLLGLFSCKKCSYWLYRMIAVRFQISCESTSRVGSENGLDPAVCRYCWGKLDGSTGQASLWQQLSISKTNALILISNVKKRFAPKDQPAAALIWWRSRPAAGLAATVDSKMAKAKQTQQTNYQMPFKRHQLIVKVGKSICHFYGTNKWCWNIIVGSSCELTPFKSKFQHESGRELKILWRCYWQIERLIYGGCTRYYSPDLGCMAYQSNITNKNKCL